MNLFDRPLRFTTEKAFFVRRGTDLHRRRLTEIIFGRENQPKDRLHPAFKKVAEDSSTNLDTARKARNTLILGGVAGFTAAQLAAGNLIPMIPAVAASAPYLAAAGIGIGAYGARWDFIDKYYPGRTRLGRLNKALHKILPIPVAQDFRNIRRGIVGAVNAPITGATTLVANGLASGWNMLSGEQNFLGDKAVQLENYGASEIDNIPGIGNLLNRTTNWLKAKSFIFPSSEANRRKLEEAKKKESAGK